MVDDGWEFDAQPGDTDVGEFAALLEVGGACVDDLLSEVDGQFPRIARVRLTDVDN